MKPSLFIVILIVTFTIFNIIFSIYDGNYNQAKFEIITLVGLVMIIGPIIFLGIKYKKNFPDE